MGINVLSLFDGISCGHLALNRAGIKVDKYFASEIDKNAIKVTQHNFPNTTQIGDVLGIKGCHLPQIDLLIGGSPCQGFSFSANKAQSTLGEEKTPHRLNLDDPRSKLFFEFVRLLEETKPKYFLLENVKMKQEFQDVISGLLGVKPQKIDSRNFSAQSRQRLYWTNIPFDKDGIDTDREGTLLRDIMEPYYGEETMSDEAALKKLIPLLESSKYRHNPAAPEQSFCFKRDTQGRILVMRPDKLKIQRIGRIGEGRHKSEIITVSSHPHVFDGKDIRKVNPLEAERLQTAPDNYTKVEGMTNGMRYRMLGNGWTVAVVSHIFEGLKNNK
jgi:DNA-cytosine methyltransferase